MLILAVSLGVLALLANMTTLRGEIWFGEKQNGQSAYLYSSGSFFRDDPITVQIASPRGYIDLVHPTSHTLIFYIDAGGSNVNQKGFTTLAADGGVDGAMGCIEISDNRGIRLYRVLNGHGSYDGVRYIRLSLEVSNPTVA